MAATPYPNQPPPYEGRNLYRDDVALRSAVTELHAAWADGEIDAWGERLGSADVHALADEANRNPPSLKRYDARGERVDEVTFHPAWHALMALATQAGEHCAPWSSERSGAQVARAAMYFLHAQVENGTQCPLTMTYASVPALARHGAEVPGLERTWMPRILARRYDPRALPAQDKDALLVGMGMTERQGGSDVRSNVTRAEREGTAYRLSGHKWFFSAPQCDAHLVLAQAGEGLTCFLLPRILPDGTRNGVALERLKDKLGNRSNASSEVLFDHALAWRLGDEGRGVPTILEMVQHTRLDCVIGSAGIVRACVARAIHHARHRIAFGRTLDAQPLMTQVLADLALESEAATLLALRLAHAFESGASDTERALARVATPAAKFYVCKRGAAVAAEAMEVLGGNGYVEEHTLARFYRELPVNSIWEGSGNVMALDVLRALADERVRDALLAEVHAGAGEDRRLRAFTAHLAERVHEAHADPAQARSLARDIVLALQASLLHRHAPAPVADAFCASRLDAAAGFQGAVAGALPPGVDARAIVHRALA